MSESFFPGYATNPMKANCHICGQEVPRDDSGRLYRHDRTMTPKAGLVISACPGSGQFPQQPEGKEGETCATVTSTEGRQEVEPLSKPAIAAILATTPAAPSTVASNAEGEVPPSSSADLAIKAAFAEGYRTGWTGSDRHPLGGRTHNTREDINLAWDDSDAKKLLADTPSPSALHEALRRYREELEEARIVIQRAKKHWETADEARVWLDIAEIHEAKAAELLTTPLPSFVSADTKRLDWLEVKPSEALVIRGAWWVRDAAGILQKGPTLRAAIDAAMKPGK